MWKFVGEHKYPHCPLLEALVRLQEGLWKDDDATLDDLCRDWISTIVTQRRVTKPKAETYTSGGGNGSNWATNHPRLLAMALTLELSLRRGDGAFWDEELCPSFESFPDAWLSTIINCGLTKTAFGEEKDGKFEYYSVDTIKRKLWHLRKQVYR